ncbi:hypothetical protein MLD38_019059 [Melastoma candidum]|uniref:Uncharacterized protein n=1 Tax=Melastoma candidum TaxID=119954 RepID=A0ACB9QZ95_9MYRT|nr:hypothetical protein MLD38_019059 [Melastoma candidum]
MAATIKQMGLIVTFLGIVSFLLGVVAENKKPAAGTPIPGKDVVICQYPSDPSVALGYLSVVFLVATTVAGYLSLFYPYQGKSIPQGIIYKNTAFSVFFNVSLFNSGLALAMLLWPTITEQLHLSRNIHKDLEYNCPTAKTGLLGGGAFLSLNSALFWLVALMLANNTRQDYFDEIEELVDEDERTSGVEIEMDGHMKPVI